MIRGSHHECIMSVSGFTNTRMQTCCTEVVAGKARVAVWLLQTGPIPLTSGIYNVHKRTQSMKQFINFTCILTAKKICKVFPLKLKKALSGMGLKSQVWSIVVLWLDSGVIASGRDSLYSINGESFSGMCVWFDRWWVSGFGEVLWGLPGHQTKHESNKW